MGSNRDTWHYLLWKKQLLANIMDIFLTSWTNFLSLEPDNRKKTLVLQDNAPVEKSSIVMKNLKDLKYLF